MTNTPSMVGEGATAYALGRNCTNTDSQIIERLFYGVGSECHPVQEHLMDAVTGISGSGPAYMYIVIGEEIFCQYDGRNQKTTILVHAEL